MLEGEAWLAWACELPTADLRKRVERRLAEVAAGTRVRYLGMFVPSEVAQGFERARDIASRSEKRRLSRPETLGECP